ncbi:MAG: flagellar hook-basal body complex protein [Eubacteriaceae bacterium]
MLRSLYSAISGMGVHQSKLNVIGNNISNVNTYGFKSSRVVFSDVLYQNVRSSMAGQNQVVEGVNTGGVNPSQLGYGVKVSSIDKIMTNASGADTGRSMDIFIDGDGFFIVNTKSTTDPEIAYTRVGALNFDSAGNLVDGNGSLIMGTTSSIDLASDPIMQEEALSMSETLLNSSETDDYGNPIIAVPSDPVGDPTNPTETGANGIISNIQLSPAILNEVTGISIQQDGAITGIINGEPLTLGYIAVATFGNPDGLNQSGNSYYQQANASGDAQIMGAGEGTAGTIVSGALEMSNVDLSREFTEMITAQRGFQANSRIVTVSDSILEELVNLKR